MKNNENNNQQDPSEITHTYDGILEHNNPMPAWWIWTFILTIIFAFHYYIHYEVLKQGQTLTQELNESMKQLKELQTVAASKFPTLSEEELEAKLKDPELAKMGAGVFQGKCAMCHGDNLEGKIGPNLIDKIWIHGGNNTAIIKTIREGVSVKGMPAWDGLLTNDEIFGIVALIKSKGM
jgi:cytochrome c oxidase cbb3-type subunit 3